jgi:hypothetical protein
LNLVISFLAHMTQSYCYHWASVVSFLHFNQLL